MDLKSTEYSVSLSPSSSSSSSENVSSPPLPSELVSHKKRAGRKKFKETRHPIYRGVRQRSNGKWVCEVRVPNNKKTRIWLGTYKTPEMAARAHDVAAIALRGNSAPLNFQDSLWVLPRAKSSSVKDIQMAALEAAESSSSSSSNGSYSATSATSAFEWTSQRHGGPSLEPSNTPFFDEEAIFNMPTLLANMAEGMLIEPPYMQTDNDMEYNVDLNLWND